MLMPVAFTFAYCTLARLASGAEWVQKAQFKDYSKSSIVLSMSSPIIAIGAPDNGENGIKSGEVCIYKKHANEVIPMGKCLRGSSPYDKFGFSIALSGKDSKRVAIGAPGSSNRSAVGQDYTRRGRVFIYEYVESLKEWVGVGGAISGKDNGEEFGTSLAISEDGNFLAICNYAPTNFNGYSPLTKVKMYLFNASTNDWDRMGQHSIKLENGRWSSVDVLISSKTNTSQQNYYVALGSSDFQQGNDFGLARLHGYDHFRNEWSQIGEDVKCYVSTSDGGGRLAQFLSTDVSLGVLNDSIMLAVSCPGTGSSYLSSNHQQKVSGLAYMYRYDTTTTEMSTPEIFGYLSDPIENARVEDLTGFRVRLSKDSKRLAVLFGGMIGIFDLNDAKDGYVQSGENIVGDKDSSIASSDIIIGGRIGLSIDISGDDIVFGTTTNEGSFYRIYGKASANSNEDIEDDDQGGKFNLEGSEGDEDDPPRDGSPGFFTGIFFTLVIFGIAFCILKIAEKKGCVQLPCMNIMAGSHDQHTTPVGTKDYQDDMEMRGLS
mmetsp:Transcript_3699/g.5656  ORF Transcript_3699/g.5656 Transcript_3699/m.5656 type:complete len:545 (-) Transcript_3699:63-1697(-)